MLVQELETHLSLMQEKSSVNRERALALVWLMAGGVALARAVGPGKLSDELLQASRNAGALLMEEDKG